MNKDWTATARLEDYLAGKLSPQEMYEVERQAMDDPFVAEALEGLSYAPASSLQAISLLQRQLHERVGAQQLTKKQSIITWQRLSIAATAAVLFIAVSTVFWMKSNVNRQSKAASQEVSVNTYVTNAQPVGGYNAYQTYLNQNNKLKGSKINEAVNLTFKVAQDGRATDIKVVSSPGQAYSAEAIRLVENGPAWELTQPASEEVSLSIGF